MTIEDICSLFDIGGEFLSCKEIGTGNINSTYKVSFLKDGETKEYLLQRINKQVFKEPTKVMDNIVRVTHHIRMMLTQRGESTKLGVLRVFCSREDDQPFIMDDCGEYWRCYRYIANSITYDSCDNLDLICKMGKAFGGFQNDLKDFPSEKLFITIPDFHNTKKRYQTFKDAIKENPRKRTEKIKNEINDLLAFEQKACELQNYLDNGQIPYRVTHNDTKCNNVSFDKDTGEQLAVLDLDTVMPGAIAHDFGDAIRFIANTREEDDSNYKKVELDLNKYEAFTKGFVGEVGKALTEIERKTLNLGVFAMTVELSIRFLTDYILGDTYFKTKYPGHNVDRGRNQLALAKDILKKYNQMEEILKKHL